MATYKALVGLTFPAGSKNIERAKAGDLDAVTKWTRVKAGATTSDIPAASVKWLLADGHIEAVSTDADVH